MKNFGEIIPEGDPLMKTIEKGSIIGEVGTDFKLRVHEVIRDPDSGADSIPIRIKGRPIKANVEDGYDFEIDFGPGYIDWRKYRIISLAEQITDLETKKGILEQELKEVNSAIDELKNQ